MYPSGQGHPTLVDSPRGDACRSALLAAIKIEPAWAVPRVCHWRWRTLGAPLLTRTLPRRTCFRAGVKFAEGGLRHRSKGLREEPKSKQVLGCRFCAPTSHDGQIRRRLLPVRPISGSRRRGCDEFRVNKHSEISSRSSSGPPAVTDPVRVGTRRTGIAESLEGVNLATGCSEPWRQQVAAGRGGGSARQTRTWGELVQSSTRKDPRGALGRLVAERARNQAQGMGLEVRTVGGALESLASGNNNGHRT